MPAFRLFWRQISALIRKELMALIKDPSARVLLLAPPIMQTMLFGYAATFDIADVPYAVVDLDRSAASGELLARLDGSGLFQREATLASPSQIAPLVDRGDVLLAITIPPDFAAKLEAGQPAPLQVILDGRNSTTAGMAGAYLASIVNGFNRDNAGSGATGGVEIVRRAWFSPNLESRWNILTGMVAGLAMIQVLMVAALSVSREREQGTFDQLLVTPLTPAQILIGKAVPSILVGLMQSTLVMAINTLWFHLPFNGSLVLFYFGMLSFMTSAVGIGLAISAIALNMQQAMLYTFFVVMPLMLLSGLITPVSNMPEFLQIATYANPLRFAMDLVRRVILEGAGLSDVAWDFVPQLGVMVVTLPLAAWLFRHRLS
ncbi:ABC transporter permease [Novosphingobium colocasiae]|uniref:Transport permease protein n=1 Tax=Novosphingobium colocasiae TaxID=1256513 RepID=A0A918PM26_9SPHN|nr:ABC transporter permease [Novosphingobium colocasiae]GGZ14344.1 transport permease protein [Novosphingobium colocasiae]